MKNILIVSSPFQDDNRIINNCRQCNQIQDGKMKLPERRGMERFSLEMASCRMSSKDAPNIDTDNFCVENICAGGAYVRTSDILPIGTGVKLDMVLPLKGNIHFSMRQSRISVTGEVIRTGETGMAIGFGKKYTIAPYPG